MNKPSMCDICGERPGTALLLSSAGDTWACDECQGIDPADYDEAPECRALSWQEELEEQTWQMTHSFNEPR
jgi:hypothetical protein